MGQSLPKPALRPYLPADLPHLVAIFEASVEELAGEDYTQAQQEAWLSVLDDADAFAARLASGLTLVATMEGSPVGFASLKGKDELDLLYVHPAAAGQGAGAMLCDALERLATARGAAAITVDASDTAQDFFARRGYRPLRRNTVPRGGEWLANTTMVKSLAANEGGGER
jgi:putative acetyltransferase